MNNKEQNRRLDNIEGSIKTINKEMGGVEKEMGKVKVDVAKIKTDLSWIKRFFWIVMGSSISSLVIGLLQLLLK